MPSRDDGPRRRLYQLGHRGPGHREAVRWEYDHYVAEMADRLIEEGWEAGDARKEAERRFGAGHRPRMERIERRRRTMTGMRALVGLGREGLAMVGRTLRRSPGFAAAVVLTLALGIGANAAMFGVVDRLLLQPPEHLERPGDLRFVQLERPTGSQSSLAFADFTDLRAHRGLAGAGGVGYREEITRGSGADAQDLRVRSATHDFFTTLGVRPILGRLFTAEEDLPGAPGTVLLSAEYWERGFGRDPGVLGRTLELSGDSYTVVGVLPEGFTGVTLDRVDLWLPMEVRQAIATEGEIWKTHRQWYWMNAVVRLAEGRTAEAAAQEATRLHRAGRSEGAEEPYTASSLGLKPLSVAGGNAEEARVVRWLTGVSLLVLLIACANVANLLLARGVRRRREVAVRMALGVSRRRLVLEHTTEAVVLAALGGAVALALAYWGGGLVQGLLLPDVYFPDGGMNARVLTFATAVSLLAGALAGIGPAVQSTRADVSAELGEARRGSSGRRSRLRGGLAVAQAALSVVLLVGAGLFVRSLQEVRDLDLGLDADRLVQATLELGVEAESAEQTGLYRSAATLLEREPAIASAVPVSVTFRSALATTLRVQGVDSLPRLPGGGPYVFGVDPGYFETLGLELLRGRGVEESDRPGGAPVAVVSATMAEAVWPEGDALGQCLLVGGDAGTCTTVVGVAEDAVRGSLQEDPFMAYYLPLGQMDGETIDVSGRANGLYLRAEGEVGEAAAVAARLLRDFDARVRFARAESLREILDPQARSWSLGAGMFMILGLLALLVASVGLYSLLAFEVAERTRELGIRTALGARQGQLLRRVVWSGARLAVAGVVVGLAVAWVAAPYVAALLFRTSPRDPVVMTGVGVVLVLVAAGASLVPGLRATRVDPVVALRAE